MKKIVKRKRKKRIQDRHIPSVACLISPSFTWDSGSGGAGHSMNDSGPFLLTVSQCLISGILPYLCPHQHISLLLLVITWKSRHSKGLFQEEGPRINISAGDPKGAF